jgi:Flp pilus assembly protein TadG
MRFPNSDIYWEIMKLARSRRDDRGAAAVEFALVLPVLIMLIFGIIDFGRMLSAKITVTEAAREGARAAALVSQEAGEARVGAATSDLDGDAVSQVVTGCDAGAPDAVATVTYRFEFVTPVGLLFGDGASDDDRNLVSKGIMPCLS